MKLKHLALAVCAGLPTSLKVGDRTHRQYQPVLWLLCLFLPLRAICAGVGESRADLLKEKGTPESIVAGGRRAILTFPDHTVVTLVDDRVTQIAGKPEYSDGSHRLVSLPAPISNERHRSVIAACVGVATALLLFRIFFSGWSAFLECLRVSGQSDWISALRGEWLEDKWATIKLFAWAGLAACAGLAIYGFPAGSGDIIWSLVTNSP